MSAAPGSVVQVGARTGLDRCLALVVRYWSFNMTLVHKRGTDWPGFGYSKQEKVELQNLAEPVSAGEFYVWLSIFVVITLAIFVAIAMAGFHFLLNAVGGEQNMARTPESVFFLMLALVALVSLSVGFPAAMLPASALAGRFYGVRESDLPDRQTTAHYFRKLWFQITRIAIIGTVALFALWIFVPSDSKFFVMAKLVLPLLSPAVAALTIAYYFSGRSLRKEAKNNQSSNSADLKRETPR